MKKLQLLLSAFLLVFLVAACSTETDEDPLDVYREIAYNALSSTEKSTVIGGWQEAEVGAWTDGNYLVVFQTTNAALGPIRVVVDPDLGRVVEILPRP
jgi:hypothetical protein